MREAKIKASRSEIKYLHDPCVDKDFSKSTKHKGKKNYKLNQIQLHKLFYSSASMKE